MVERTLSDEIVVIVEDCIAKLPVNISGTITKIYPDNFVDITTDTGTTISYIECLGSPELNRKGIVVFTENNFDNPFFICESTGGGGGDLSAYVKKSDVHLKFELQDNGTILIGLDIGDGF